MMMIQPKLLLSIGEKNENINMLHDHDHLSLPEALATLDKGKYVKLCFISSFYCFVFSTQGRLEFGGRIVMTTLIRDDLNDVFLRDSNGKFMKFDIGESIALLHICSHGVLPLQPLCMASSFIPRNNTITQPSSAHPSLTPASTSNSQ
jgi:hypothetical protein